MYATAVGELRITNDSHIAAFPRAQALLSNKERDMFQALVLKYEMEVKNPDYGIYVSNFIFMINFCLKSID